MKVSNQLLKELIILGWNQSEFNSNTWVRGNSQLIHVEQDRWDLVVDGKSRYWDEGFNLTERNLLRGLYLYSGRDKMCTYGWEYELFNGEWVHPVWGYYESQKNLYVNSSGHPLFRRWDDEDIVPLCDIDSKPEKEVVDIPEVFRLDIDGNGFLALYFNGKVIPSVVKKDQALAVIERYNYCMRKL